MCPCIAQIAYVKYPVHGRVRFHCAIGMMESVRLLLVWAGLACSSVLMGQAPSQQGQVLPQTVTLDQAIQEALAKNLDLAAEKWNVSIAEAREITARLRPNPVLTVSGQTLNVLGATYSPATPLGPNQMNIHTDIPFERANKRERRVELAKEQKSLAELGVREVMRQVIFTVQSAFVDVQQAKNNVALAKENLASLEGVVTVNEARLNSGDLAQVELERSRVAAYQYRTAVQQAELQVSQAKTQLQYLMGRLQRSPDFDTAGDLRRDVLMETPAEISTKALAFRPDYLGGTQSQTRSQADLRLQLANGKVDYVIGTEYTRQQAYSVSGSSMGIYFSMPLPVFNRNQGEIARAEREIALAGARRTALEASINVEVERAYQQYTVSRRVLADLETNMLMKARSVRDTTEYSYRRGEATLVEFLDAQRAFNEAMQTFNDAKANFARSLYLIDTVSGATVSGN
jgi:outer membrane protein, heavy metal efflux system